MTLSLTDRQLEHLQFAASLLPVSDRDAFLRSVAGRLSVATPTDGDLAAVLSFVLQGRDISVSPSLFLPEGDDENAIRKRRHRL
jgi:hypothetical protein